MEQPYITVKISIEDAARRMLLADYKRRAAELDKIAQLVSEARENLQSFMWQCGIAPDVELVAASADDPLTVPTKPASR